MTKISIVGPGTMGCGIAQTALVSGFEVVLIGHSEESAKSGFQKLKSNFERAVSKGKLTKEQEDKAMSRLKLSWSTNDAADSYIVIEAVPEDIKLKSEVLSEIEKRVGKDAIIATNTSSISINALAESLNTPERFIGLHFFNPVQVMKSVEMITGKKTSGSTLDKSKEIVGKLGKTAIVVNDSPGFVSNRILMPFINEAILVLEERVATREAIDSIAKLGFNHPMGPLELADFIGLDVCKDIMDAIYEQTNNPKFKPSALLVRLVEVGELGRKTGKGFYEYLCF